MLVKQVSTKLRNKKSALNKNSFINMLNMICGQQSGTNILRIYGSILSLKVLITGNSTLTNCGAFGNRIVFFVQTSSLVKPKSQYVKNVHRPIRNIWITEDMIQSTNAHIIECYIKMWCGLPQAIARLNFL